MAKIVRYNGGRESFYCCSDPKDLVVGKSYTVVREKDRGWQTDYTLMGVKGKFNSAWFDEVYPIDPSMVIAHNIPMVGKRFVCYKIQLVNGQTELIGLRTSSVKKVVGICTNVYKVTTQNNIYIVHVS